MKKGDETLEFEEQKEDHKVIEFKSRAQIAQGGKEPSDPNWLIGKNEGCIFLARRKKYPDGQNNSDEELHLFTVLSKKGNAVWLCLALPEDKALERWVDSFRFSNNWELFELVQEGYNT